MFNKKIFLLVIGILLLSIMTLGYAALKEKIEIDGVATIDSTYNVAITKVELASTTGTAVQKALPTYTKLSAHFSVGLTDIADKIVYNVEITNSGTVDVKLNNGAINITGGHINVTKSGVANGDILLHGETKVLTLTISYKGPEQASEITGTVDLNLEYTRLKGGTGEVVPETNPSQETDYTYYFQLPPDWGSNTAYVHFYNTSTDASYKAWPGDEMTLHDATLKIYSCKVTQNILDNYDALVFSNGSQTNRQTIDIETSNDNLGKIYVPELYPEGDDVRIYFKGSANWAPYVYLWKDGNNNGWPGTQFNTKVNKTVYTTTINKNTYNKMIFNKGYGGDANQSADLDVPTHSDLTFEISGAKNRVYYSGDWHSLNSWKTSEYSTWQSGDYARFVAAQQALNY